MVADREELERRVARAVCVEVLLIDPDVADDVVTGTSLLAARAVLDVLGLTEETVWTDGGNYHVWGQIVLDGDDMYVRGSRGPATDEQLRAAGLIKKRRWITEWEEITDD